MGEQRGCERSGLQTQTSFPTFILRSESNVCELEQEFDFCDICLLSKLRFLLWQGNLKEISYLKVGFHFQVKVFQCNFRIYFTPFRWNHILLNKTNMSASLWCLFKQCFVECRQWKVKLHGSMELSPKILNRHRGQRISVSKAIAMRLQNFRTKKRIGASN
jgi:hypothetical protein